MIYDSCSFCVHLIWQHTTDLRGREICLNYPDHTLVLEKDIDADNDVIINTNFFVLKPGCTIRAGGAVNITTKKSTAVFGNIHGQSISICAERLYELGKLQATYGKPKLNIEEDHFVAPIVHGQRDLFSQDMHRIGVYLGFKEQSGEAVYKFSRLPGGYHTLEN